ncbi:carboxylate--amine ligase [Aggregicoccus sp. 17bor-14]|uniref:ATP-grasp domain-containing protein n=1 Tax=Myxococcaceae TaxID=31 RepID=UPI0012F425B0|nr:carboxylate--amine ligase [Simulacricoccus sp. 17bor-14]MRI89167.1 carboxylate--amine ligase [Aggregicoccus sp. 17bor-14]
MNVVFLSPHFPPQYPHFVSALRERGVRVLGVGDAPQDSLPGELRGALAEYYYVPSLGDADALLRAVGYFTWRHGRIARIESLNESWLAVEAELREAFHVPGLLPADLERLRTKAGMARVFEEAGVPHPPTLRVRDPAGLKAFAARVGYPLVLKPNVGVGAAQTFGVASDAEVDRALAGSVGDRVAQPYVKGTIVTYDGMVDREGEPFFSLSHEYSDGVMETVNEARDISFWSLKSTPPELERLGRACLRALGLRERWFHLEFFRLADGSYVALEANLRPPGAFMTDMMNYACDVDVYRLWARLVTGDLMKGFSYTPRSHICHSARRAERAYRLDTGELLGRLGDRLVLHRTLPSVYHAAMGHEMYLTRHADLQDLRECVRIIQARA